MTHHFFFETGNRDASSHPFLFAVWHSQATENRMLQAIPGFPAKILL